MMYGYHGSIGSQYHGLMSCFGIVSFAIGMLAFLALIIIAIAIIVRVIRHRNTVFHMHGNYNKPDSTSAAIEILNSRLAKGELTVEEYKVLKEEIIKP